MVIEPAVEVNPVVDASSSQANGWRPDAGEQSPADAEIAGGLLAGKATRRDGRAGIGFIEIGHDSLRLTCCPKR
jgi:hypothetical protein